MEMAKTVDDTHPANEADAPADNVTKLHKESLDTDALIKVAEDIETLDEKIEEIMAAARKKAQPSKDKRKDMVKAMAEIIPKQIGACILSQRKHLRKASNVTDRLNDGQKRDFNDVIDELGDWASTPLGSLQAQLDPHHAAE